METVKVDVRKLQMLNDRINQCIDALSQVRLSVHGISHSAGAPTQAAGLGDPRLAYGMPNVPFGGLAHSAFPQSAAAYGQGFGQGFGQSIGQPFAQPFGQGFGQQLGQGIPTPFGLGSIGGQIPFGAGGGLSHTGLESDVTYARPLAADPWLAARVAQTFPYATLPVPPVLYL